MGRKWVLNASPLIVLGKISAIHLLEEMCSHLVIPDRSLVQKIYNLAEEE